MGRHWPGEGMTPVASLLVLLRRDPVVDVPVHEGATEEYADELREMREAIAADVEFDRTEDARDRYQEEVTT